MFYGFGETVKNAFSLIYTKLFWGFDKKLIRLPFYCRNKNNVHMGKKFACGYSCRITAGRSESGRIIIGDNFSMGDFCQIEGGGGIIIGRNVMFASKVFVSTNSHGIYNDRFCEFDQLKQSSPSSPPGERKVVKKRIVIGDNVWVGNAAMILMGVTIGSGAIVGAGSVVTKDVPEDCIVAGNPARVLKRWDREQETWLIV